MVPGSQLVAEIWDYWLYSMNAPFGRTRGGEPDSPYNGFCTITHFQICRGLDQVRGLASTHNGEPRAGGRRRGRGNRRRLGTRLWRVLWRWSRRCAGGQQAATRAQVQAGRGDQLRAVQASTAVLGSRGACSEHRIGSAARRCSDSSACRPRHGRARETVAASSLFANRRAADARGPVASTRTRHRVAPAPTSVDGNLPPTLGPAPGNQRPDPGAQPVPPPPRHPSTWLAHARPCRAQLALRSASSPGAPLARHGASRLRPADRDMTRDSNTVQNQLYGESGSPPRVRPNGAFIE